jgi:CYTH domain-containing protein
MGTEIERKYLVHEDAAWRNIPGTLYRQGYLSTVKERTVRVRTIGDKGYLTIKGITVGATRMEYEYEIPVNEADELLDLLCERPLIEKRRRLLEFDGVTWEVDEFFGDNDGLILAEVELEEEEQSFARPSWISLEVTDDARYFNANLVSFPYRQWPENKSESR